MGESEPSEFDEEWYVSTYPDVAKAIKEGRLIRGLDHYLAHGRREGRLPTRTAGLTTGLEYRLLSAQQTTLSTLDELGIKRITDKCSLDHDYLRKYERLFSPFRDLPITLLEIGVFDGGSLKLWEDYFPRATIIGLDIRKECKEHECGRRIVEIASQADATALKIIGTRYQPTIIIDDGSHKADHILISFEALYPTLRSGGLYIVEDLGMHTGAGAKMYRGAAETSPQEYFLKLANKVVCPADNVLVGPESLATEGVEFFSNLVVIKKKPDRERDPIGQRRMLVESVNSAATWGWFSSFILGKGGSPDEAITCAERAIALAPEESVHHLQLSYALEHASRLNDALSAAVRAVELSHNHWPMVKRVEALAAKKRE
jgi:cephalosporin hydroxylase